jgi:transposase
VRDEKSQCQALERTQPMLPMGFGYVEGVTHDYVRHGTTTLFAALNVLNGAVLATCKAASSASGVPVGSTRNRQGRTG